MRFGIVRTDCDRLTVCRDCIVGLPCIFQSDAKICECLDAIGIERDGLPVCGDGAGELAGTEQGIAQVSIRFVEIRLECDGVPAGGDRLVELAHAEQGVAEIVVGFGEIRSQRDRLPANVGGLFESSNPFQRRSEVAKSIRKNRPQRHGDPIGTDRLFQLPDTEKSIPEIAVGVGKTRPQGNRTAKHHHRQVAAAQLQPDHSKVVDRINVLGIGGDDLLIDAFRLAQPPRLVVLQCEVERLLNGYFSHIGSGFCRHRSTPGFPHLSVCRLDASSEHRRVHQRGLLHPLPKRFTQLFEFR